MTLTPADATAVLRETEAMEKRSSMLRGYQSASPHLIIWGIAWGIGYTGDYFLPSAWQNTMWLALVGLGIAGDIAAGIADGRNQVRAPGMIILFVTFVVFVGGTFAVMQPHDARQVAAFFPLLVAAGYGIMGALGARRLLIIAACIAVLTLGGFFGLGNLFYLWMAAVGGGGLVAGGLWLRRA